MNNDEFFWNFAAYIRRQIGWSGTVFGPGSRQAGVCDHIRKELTEILEASATGEPTLPEWIDVIILGLDGAWRSQTIADSPEMRAIGEQRPWTPDAIARMICAALDAKFAKNAARTWPDWRTADPDKAIEHDRSKD